MSRSLLKNDAGELVEIYWKITMTLIAGFMKDNCPILMGDLLISNIKDSTNEFVIPTVGKITPSTLQKGNYRPAAVSQKVNLLSPKLALAWSGNLLEAREFMGQVVGARLHNNPSRESMLEIYNDLSPNDLSIIGLLRDESGVTLFDINSTQVDRPNRSFEWFKASGTGYNRLQSLLSNSDSKVTSGTPNKLELAISSAMGIATSLLAFELETTIPLQELFGAGYEILHPIGVRLVKFDDLTYYFWLAEEVGFERWRLAFPALVMKYSYHGDILIIRSVRLSTNGQSESFEIESDEIHVINPIYRLVAEHELIGYVPVSLNSKTVCNVFLWKNLDNQTGAFSTFGRYSDQSSPILWSNERALGEGIDVNLEFIHETITKLTSAFGSKPKR